VKRNKESYYLIHCKNNVLLLREKKKARVHDMQKCNTGKELGIRLCAVYRKNVQVNNETIEQPF
jgi:hypothetical protein